VVCTACCTRSSKKEEAKPDSGRGSGQRAMCSGRRASGGDRGMATEIGNGRAVVLVTTARARRAERPCIFAPNTVRAADHGSSDCTAGRGEPAPRIPPLNSQATIPVQHRLSLPFERSVQKAGRRLYIPRTFVFECLARGPPSAR
jgi:hypothetical protein